MVMHKDRKGFFQVKEGLSKTRSNITSGLMNW